MSSIKRKLCIVVLLLGISMQGVAQKSLNPKAIIEAFDSTVYRYDGNWEQLDQLADEICKKTNNNPMILVGLGNAFLNQAVVQSGAIPEHRQLGFKYLTLAVNKHKRYVPAYIAYANAYKATKLGGYGFADDNKIDSVYYWCQQAIDASPDNPMGYEAYAQMLAYDKPEAVYDMLSQMKSHNPNYPVELVTAGLLSDAGRGSMAVGYYDKVNMDNMTKEQLLHYQELLHDAQNWEQCLKVATFGAQKFPDEMKFVLYLFHSNYSLAKDVEGQSVLSADDSTKVSLYLKDAIDAWETMVKKPQGNYQFELNDYMVAAAAYEMYGDTQAAADLYHYCIQMDSVDTKFYDQCYRNLTKLYTNDRRWSDADKAYRDYISNLKERKASDETIVRWYYLHTYLYYLKYRNQSDEQDLETNVGDNLKGISIIEECMKNYPDYMKTHFDDENGYVGDFYFFNITFNGYIVNQYWVPEVKESDFATEYGKQYAEKVVELYGQKPAHTQDRSSYMALACDYLGYYYNTKYHKLKQTADLRISQSYWKRALEANPEDKHALANYKGK